MPRASHALSGAAGRSQLSPESLRLGGRIAAPGRPCGLPSSPERPRVPANQPRGLSGAHAQSPASSLVGSGFRVHSEEPPAHRYLHPRRPPPPAPFLTKRLGSSFAWLPQKAAPNLARSWGSRVPERRGYRGPGAWAGISGRVSLPIQGPLRPACAPGCRTQAAADPNPAYKATYSPPEGGQATEHAQC